MRDHAIGVRKAPGRKRVGREPLMDQRKRGLVTRVHEVAVIGRKLTHQHHALVDDGAGRHRDGVKLQDLRSPDREDAIGDDLADDIEAPLKIVLGRDVGGTSDEDLLHHRLDRLDAFAKHGIVDRHVAPAEHVQALGRDDLLDDSARLLTRLGLTRHEELADRVMTRRRQLETELGAFASKERVRNLGQHAAAVAKRGIRAHRAAMVEVDQNLQALFEDVMRLAVLHVGHEADAAGIVLFRGIVERLGRRRQRIPTGCGPREAAAQLVESRLSHGAHLSAPRAVARPARPLFQIFRRMMDKGGR